MEAEDRATGSTERLEAIGAVSVVPIEPTAADEILSFVIVSSSPTTPPGVPVIACSTSSADSKTTNPQAAYHGTLELFQGEGFQLVSDDPPIVRLDL